MRVANRRSKLMFLSLVRKSVNILRGSNRSGAILRFRPEVEILESRRLLSLSVGPNVNVSRLPSGH